MLSVVVTAVDGGESLERCLQALEAQVDAGEMEILVPFDDSVPSLSEVSARFPAVRFIDLGHVRTLHSASSPAGQHELYDMRRSAGLAQARGELIAMLEDRGAPRADWARQIRRLHESPAAAIGGAIENSNNGALNWAVYLCDFGRYQLPFFRHSASYVSDTNICYKRSAIEATREVWRERYHETTVHWALQRNGSTLELAPEMVVEQDRGSLSLRALLVERIQFGRLYAYTRARELPVHRRILLAPATVILPLLLLSRIARRQWRGPTFRHFVRALPALIVLLSAWSLGECLGYLTKRA